MIRKLTPYSETRDSSIPALGRIPRHWDLRQLGRIGRFSKGSGGTKEDALSAGVPCIRYGDLYMHHEFFITRSASFVASERAVDYTPIRFGDILFAGSGETIEEIGKSAVNLLDGPAVCGGDVIVLRPTTRVNPRFMGYATGCWSAAYQKSSMGRGITVMHIYGDEIKYVWVALPPISEQAACVRFLDHADRRIRRYIRAKQNLIKLLGEQKQAIIHRAVTRGLDPTVRLKPSGVPWLGDVPEHWEVSRVKAEFHCLNRRRVPLSGTERGAMTSRRYDYYGASGVIDKVDDFLFDEDLLLIAEDGANLVLRNLPLAIVARGKFWVNNHAHILKPKRGNLEYLAALMERLNYMPWISGAAQPKLTQDRLMSIGIAVPPRDEQDRVIAAVLKETGPLRAAIDRAQSEVNLVREYRSRLIADVVTGKRDVREVAADLLDLTDNADLLGDCELDEFAEFDGNEIEDLDEVSA